MGKHEPIAGKMNIIWLIVSKPGTIPPPCRMRKIFSTGLAFSTLSRKAGARKNPAAERDEIPGGHLRFAKTPRFALSSLTYMSI